MDLLDIRKAFVQASGRFDLVVDTTHYVNNSANIGADFFINAGLRLLDSLEGSMPSSYRKDISAGDYKLTFKYARAIDRVDIMNADGRKTLTPVRLETLRETYPLDPDKIGRGTPLMYAPMKGFLSPEQKSLTLANFSTEFTYDHYGVIFGASRYQYNGILFMPPADTTYTVTVWGWFFNALEEDDDVCWWSENYPEVVIMAAQCVVEMFYRNSSGVADWMSAITQYLRGVDIDRVREEISIAGNQIKG